MEELFYNSTSLKWLSIQRGKTSDEMIHHALYIFSHAYFLFSFNTFIPRTTCNSTTLLARMTLNFSNLFNGNEHLGRNMNKFMNENWKEILDDLKVTINDAFGNVFSKIIKHVISNFPYDEMFNWICKYRTTIINIGKSGVFTFSLWLIVKQQSWLFCYFLRLLVELLRFVRDLTNKLEKFLKINF